MPRPTAEDIADRFLRLLADEGLPPPDEIEYGDDELVFVYRDRKLAVVVELSEDAADGPPDGPGDDP